MATCSFKNHAIFAGGHRGSGNYSNVIDIYDKNLTKGEATSLSVARGYVAGATTIKHALIAGGNAGNASAVVDGYDENLTRNSVTSLTIARSNLSGISIGKAIFAGGYYSTTMYNNVDSYDSNLVLKAETALTQTKQRLAGARVGNCGFLAGGAGGNTSGSSVRNTVDAWLGKFDIQIFPNTIYKLNSVTEKKATDFTILSYDTPVTGHMKISSIMMK